MLFSRTFSLVMIENHDAEYYTYYLSYCRIIAHCKSVFRCHFTFFFRYHFTFVYTHLILKDHFTYFTCIKRASRRALVMSRIYAYLDI